MPTNSTHDPFLYTNQRLLNDQALENATGAGSLPWTCLHDGRVGRPPRAQPTPAAGASPRLGNGLPRLKPG